MIAGVIGATGYAGAELVRLLAEHPEVTGLSLASVSYAGASIEQVYPHFQGTVSTVLKKPEAVLDEADLVFASLPHGVGEDYARTCVEKHIPYIDLSADFRFDEDEATFSAWYGKPYRYPELHSHSVYGLPELNRERIKHAAIIGNPGCYPTGASLGAFPALVHGLSLAGTVIVDSASGITGAGREPAPAYHYPECADSVTPYKVGSHRHTPEISRNFQAMAKKPVPVIFTPHLVPMNRGILSTIYMPLPEEWRVIAGSRPPAPEIAEKAAVIRNRYAAFYRDEPFVRVLPAGTTASTNRVRHSNYCDISIHLDPAASMLIIVSAIDNMVKGAAGQAIQNMNIRLGFKEDAGLHAIPSCF
jgi:N-acetyl-gamma-glutamyl-phosphate reductase